MSVLENLLHLQENDTAADQLRHRRDHLPERQQVARLEADAAELATRRSEVGADRDVLVREQKRLEDEIAGVEAKRTETDAQLYSGAVTSPRELQGLQDEVTALGRRQEALEDELLEVLTSLEPLDEALADIDRRDAEIADQQQSARTALDEAESAIDNELAEVESRRDAAAREIPDDQLADYETKRRQLGGIAVARLVGGSCGGCHLTLSAVEIDRIRKLPSDQPAICEECGRLLVH